MPPNYNPWGTPIFPGDTAPQPYENYASPPVANLLSSIAGALGKAFMAPGQALQSTTPITSDQMVKPAADLAMMTTLGAGAAPQEANSLNMGIKAYHGSPHDFDAFSLDKIGTGEGAQAYGHGLYFAENPQTAQAYRDALELGKGGPGRPDFLTPELFARQAMDTVGGDTKQAIARIQNSWDKMKGLDPRFRMAGSDERYAKAIELLQQDKPIGGGKMYEVNINADPAHFLDWDKPLSEQPQANKVMDAINARRGETEAKLFPLNPAKMTGDQAYRMLHPESRFNSGAATNTLREAGIPGIKYLDQGSRASGDGSRNYVVFNDKLIDIMRKYAIPGLLGAPIFAGEQKS